MVRRSQRVAGVRAPSSRHGAWGKGKHDGVCETILLKIYQAFGCGVNKYKLVRKWDADHQLRCKALLITTWITHCL